MSSDPIGDALRAELKEIVDFMENSSDGHSIEFDFFADGTVVQIHTQNSIYNLQVLDCNKCIAIVSGSSQHLIGSTKCHVNGCTAGGSAIKIGHLVIGGHLELKLLDTENGSCVLTTSAISKIVFRHS